MKDLEKILPKLNAYSQKGVEIISKHGTLITVTVAGIAIFASVMQAQAYLNPKRNETLYIEKSSSSSTKTINEDIVKKLQETQNDQNISVDSNFVPDRNNPFNE